MAMDHYNPNIKSIFRNGGLSCAFYFDVSAGKSRPRLKQTYFVLHFSKMILCIKAYEELFEQ